MRCEVCGDRWSDVRDSRKLRDSVRRRRECRACGHRWTTYELSKSRVEELKSARDRLIETIKAFSKAGW